MNRHVGLGCGYGQPDGPDDTVKECDCYTYDEMDHYLKETDEKRNDTVHDVHDKGATQATKS